MKTSQLSSLCCTSKLILSTINLFLLLVAWIQVRFFLRLKAIGSLESLYNSSSTPAVTIVVPAYNEQETIVESVRALTNLYTHATKSSSSTTARATTRSRSSRTPSVSAVGNWGTNRWSPPPAFGILMKRCRREM